MSGLGFRRGMRCVFLDKALNHTAMLSFGKSNLFVVIPCFCTATITQSKSFFGRQALCLSALLCDLTCRCWCCCCHRRRGHPSAFASHSEASASVMNALTRPHKKAFGGSADNSDVLKTFCVQSQSSRCSSRMTR